MQNRKNTTIWDVAVIGGGPAGMMAAGRAAECGAKTTLLEKNSTLGKKLLITGGGRCNVTNAELNTRSFLSFFKKNSQFLFSAFARWGVKETLDFFHEHNMPTKIEAEKRVFPASDSAQSVLRVLAEYMKEGNVTICTNTRVAGLLKQDQRIGALLLKDGTRMQANAYVLATGGKSRPETGSTGDGFAWLQSIGHKVVEPNMALVPIVVKDTWVKKLQGVSLSDVKITLLQNGVQQNTGRGSILFTHFGLSGPAILNLSKDVGELLKYGEVVISLDLLPLLNEQKLDASIREIMAKQPNKKLKNCLNVLVPSVLVPVTLELSGVRAETFNHSVTREERLRLGKLLKHMSIRASRLLGVEKAIVTSGGVILKEVDFTTMRSRLFENLYVTGDILDIDRPSGGYSLQLCWTTGYIAGTSTAGKTLLPI